MGKTVNPTWVQGHYRFRNDDGTMATATYIAAEDTSASIAADTNFRLRMSWGESAGQTTSTNSGTITLQFAVNGGGFTTVTGSTAVKFSTSGTVGDASTETTQRLTLPTGVASWGSVAEFDSNNSVAGAALVDTGREAEFCLQLDSGQLTGGDSITFQLLRGGAAFNSADATPTLTASIPVTHTATGTLSAGTGALSGSANRTSPSVTHDATGTLSAGNGSLAGSANRARQHASTGTLSAGTGSLSGSANKFRAFDATGSLSGGAGVLSGSAERSRVRDASGALSGGTGTLAGSAARERIRDTSGALIAGTGALSGASARTRVRDATGTLTAGAGALSGSASRTGAAVTHDGTGALSGGAGALSGSAARIRIRDASGSLAGAGAAVAGDAARSRVRTASGALVGAGSLVGAALRTPAPVSHDATGVLVGAGAVLVGAGATPARLTEAQRIGWAKFYSGAGRSRG